VADATGDSDGVTPSREKERQVLESFMETFGAKPILQNNGAWGDDACVPSTPTNSSLFCWLAAE
jgi:hypothetical protein